MKETKTRLSDDSATTEKERDAMTEFELFLAEHDETLTVCGGMLLFLCCFPQIIPTLINLAIVGMVVLAVIAVLANLLS